MSTSKQRTLRYINDHPEQFTFCKTCCSFNISPNVACHNCGSKDLTADIQAHLEVEKDYCENVLDQGLGETWYTVR